MKLSFEYEYECECEFSQRFATPALLCILSTHSTHFLLLHPTWKLPLQWAKTYNCLAPLSCFFYAETVTTKRNELRSVWGMGGRVARERGKPETGQAYGQASWNEWMDGWMRKVASAKTKVNLNNKTPMGKKPKQWSTRNSKWGGGVLRERW